MTKALSTPIWGWDMRNDDVVLVVDGLSTSYGIVPALHEVSLDVRRGEIVTLIGANGAGKSTLMKCIAGLHPSTARGIRVHDKEVSGASPDAIVKYGLSLVPEGRRLFGEMSVRDNLDLGAYCRQDKAAIAKDFENVMSYFPDLEAKLDVPAHTLSGGQQQMVAVGRALMSDPRILLLDEPTIGLAPVVVDKIAEVLRTVRDTGVEVLLVEQNAEIALDMADYAYVLERGSVVRQGPAPELASDPGVRRAYMGM